MYKQLIFILVCSLVVSMNVFSAINNISPSVKVYQKEVNGVVVQQNGHELVIYGIPVERKSPADYILFTNAFISKATLTIILSLRLVRNPYLRKIPDKRE